MLVIQGNAALAPAAKLAQILVLADAVDASPSVADMAQFMDILLSPPPVVAGPPAAPAAAAAGPPVAAGPPAAAAAPPAAAAAPPPVWVPTPAQTQALLAVVGPPGAPAGILFLPPYNTGGLLNGAAALAFVNFDRRLLALQLVIRIADSKKIDQRSHPMCGPNVLMEDFARRRPHQYVLYVAGLATVRTGDITMQNGTQKTITLEADSNLLRANPAHATIAQADYIALASLRDQGHFYVHMPYESKWTNQMLEGATMAMSLKKWMEDAGYQQVQNNTISRGNNLVAKMIPISVARAAFGEAIMRGNILLAQAHLAAGKTVFLAVASNFAKFALGHAGRHSTFMQAFGGHWVALRQVIVGAHGVQFSIRTWGQDTPAMVVMPWTKISNWYRGFLSGLP